ncbi:MAG TPA: DUF5696 domain-containing protein [Pyrinomonadaceae bacterium]|nr:DUF5696 domain-containing protein [Pyrinomonadaceae bacterium]
MSGHPRNYKKVIILTCGALLIAFFRTGSAQGLTREQWGAPDVTVSKSGSTWAIIGKKNRVTLNASDLSLKVNAGSQTWQMVRSSTSDMTVRTDGRDVDLRLADAKRIEIVPYDTGFKKGVKISLGNWKDQNKPLDLELTLTVCLEGADDELVFDIAANEKRSTLRQLNWPTALEASTVDYTVLSNGRGTLLPRNWPKEYYPIRSITREGKIAATDHSVLQSHVIESWSMSWWGFERGKSAMMVIVETPDDAAYQFKHPAGGPTVIGPQWRAQLGRFNYPRSVRMVFFENGNYVDMAKRYRQFVMDTGLFVSLKEKIARTPAVADLIGTPQVRTSILRDLSPESDRYDKTDKTKNYSLTTFDERAKQLRALKARGFDHLLVMVSGWPHLGYDHQHPDPLPPPESAGGWEGLKRLYDTARELGYAFTMHDQYRDYYLDAPSYDPQFAIHEEDDSKPAHAFAGSRFGDSKERQIPFMSHWDGGKQSYLNARFQLGHLLKNYRLIFDHGIKPNGIYIDVIGYVPPDEDYNPEHPTTHTEAMKGQIAMLNWARRNLGITLTEAGSDWVIPYADSINQSGGGSKAIAVPLYQLVYHDAVVMSYGFRDVPSLLRGLLGGGVPEMPVTPTADDKEIFPLIGAMAKLNKRVAFQEMTNHEFLDVNRTKERTTFADGTTVTVDWKTNTYEIKPELN